MQLLSALYSSIYYTSAEKNRVKIEIEAGLGVPDGCLPLFAVIGFISAILASGFSLKQTALSKTHFNGCLLFFFPTPPFFRNHVKADVLDLGPHPFGTFLAKLIIFPIFTTITTKFF